MQDTISTRINLLRFPLIVGVLYIHAYGSTVHLSSESVGLAHTSYLVEFVRFFVSYGVARVAVPLFFMISGYLLFKERRFSLELYRSKLQKRVGTLLIPFLFWNIATLLLYMLGERIPQTARFFSHGNILATYHAMDYANAIFGIWSLPVAYQFWFVRDLMLLVLLSPIVYFLAAGRVRLLALPLLSGLYLAGLWNLPWPGLEATFFFFLGVYLSLQRVDVNRVDAYGKLLAAAFAVALVVYTAAHQVQPWSHGLVVLLGVPTAWWVAGLLARGDSSLKHGLLHAAEASFFVYAAHEPLLTILRKVAYATLRPQNGALVLGLYFLIPVLVIAITLALFALLKRIAPTPLKIISGNRG